MPDYRLERRYMVIKTKYLTAQQLHALETCLWENALPTVSGVVIEEDWPEYTPVVDMLFGRIDREASAN